MKDFRIFSALRHSFGRFCGSGLMIIGRLGSSELQKRRRVGCEDGEQVSSLKGIWGVVGDFAEVFGRDYSTERERSIGRQGYDGGAAVGSGNESSGIRLCAGVALIRAQHGVSLCCFMTLYYMQ